jgi:hypothetical protein
LPQKGLDDRIVQKLPRPSGLAKGYAACERNLSIDCKISERGEVWSCESNSALGGCPSNIAEGHARQGRAEFRHYVSIAIGSVAELETQLMLSADLGYLAQPTADDLLSKLDTIGKMLRGLQKSLSDPASTSPKLPVSSLQPQVPSL